jgi:NADH-quinone oxidoreductase subunit F
MDRPHDWPDLLPRLAASGLRGRGGGWFPAARKWHAVRVEGGDPLVVANGAEGEPGSIKDRHVMLTRPGDVLAGLEIAARVVGAREAIVFLKASFDGPAAALDGALRERPPAAVSVSIRRGDDSYITGEETALLESLEGRRPWPRPKPPLPAAVGFRGRPTLVQNVETLARVSAALDDPDRFRESEKTFVSVWGHVRRPGVYEVPLGTPLGRIVEDHGGGAPDGIGLLFPAGPSAAPLTDVHLDLPLHPDALREAGSGLGTASLLVVGRSVCPLSVGLSLAGFFAREACGQCPPCTVGTQSLERVLRGLDRGPCRPRDLQALAETGGFMKDHGYCAHSRTAAAAVAGLLARVPDEVARHLEAGGRHCGRAAADPFAPGSPARTAVEATL